MNYCTPSQFVQGAGMLDELSQLFDVPSDLMRATIESADRGAWSADEIASADAALSSLQATADRVDSEIDAYLTRRGYGLPLSSTLHPVLVSWARNIMRYHVAPQRDVTEETKGRIERDYTHTLRQLTMVARGEIGIGANDPLTDDAGVPDVSGPPRLFSRASLRRF